MNPVVVLAPSAGSGKKQVVPAERRNETVAPTGDVKRVNLERQLSVPIPDIVLDMYATVIAAVREAFASIMTAGGKNASSRRGKG